MKKQTVTLCISLVLLSLLLSACAPKVPAETTPDQTTAPATSPADTTEEAPMKIQYQTPRDYAFWLAETEKLLSSYDEEDPYYTLSGDEALYAESASYYLYGLATAYRTTLNAGYLDLLALLCSNMLSTIADKDGDGYLNWGTGLYNNGKYDEFAMHAGVNVTSFATFILLIRADPALAGRTSPVNAFSGTYGALADELERICVDHLVPAFEADFHPAFGVYMSRAGSGNYGGAAGYTNPHNQYLAFASGLYSLALVSSENAASYVARADTMAQVFKGWLRIKDDGFISWNYDDTFYAGDHGHVILEDYSHAMLDYLAAIDAYHRGAVFSYDDISLFANNLSENMFNGDFSDVRVSEYVTGGTWASYSGLPYIYNILLSRYGDREKIWHISEGGYQGRLYDAAMIFSMHPDAPAPESFGLTLPANNAREVDPGAAIFHWTPSKNAADYTLLISETEGFSSLTVSRPFIASSGAFVDGLLGGKTYFWKVMSRNENGMAESPVFSFATKEEAKLAPKVLSFSYKLGEASPTEGRTLRVYLHRELLAELPFDEGRQWQTFSLDLTEKISVSKTAGIKIGLYSDQAEPAGEALYLDDISLTGSDRHFGFTDENEEYTVWGRPALYIRRHKSQAENGVLKLLLPFYSEVKMFANNVGTGKIVNEIFADFGFTFPQEHFPQE